MAKFRKKPVVIEAEQFNPNRTSQPRSVCVCRNVGTLAADPEATWPNVIGKPHVHTMHDNQAVYLESGDWIIPEPDGEHFYPCKPDVFAATYEPVEEP